MVLSSLSNVKSNNRLLYCSSTTSKLSSMSGVRLLMINISMETVVLVTYLFVYFCNVRYRNRLVHNIWHNDHSVAEGLSERCEDTHIIVFAV